MLLIQDHLIIISLIVTLQWSNTVLLLVFHERSSRGCEACCLLLDPFKMRYIALGLSQNMKWAQYFSTPQTLLYSLSAVSV